MKVTKLLSAEELAKVTRKSDLKGAWVVACQLLQVAAIFFVVAAWPNPLTLILGALLLGGRQLGFFVLEHECGHGTLFKTQCLNDWVGHWLTGALGFANMDAYMRQHLVHHRRAGSQEDPDLANYQDYPISRQRLRRKLKRDLTGKTGWRYLKGVLTATTCMSRLPEEKRQSLKRGLIVNGLLLLILTASGNAWLYLLWLVALVFVNPLVTRIRQIGEHAAVPALTSEDPRENTRTLHANWLERALICPHRVNYHLEHHLLPSVPSYNLKKLHKLLAAKGYYEGVHFSKGYINMLQEVTNPAPKSAA